MKNVLLRRFLELPAQAGGAVVTGIRRPLGYLKVTPTGTAAGITLPTPVSGYPLGLAIIQCFGSASTDFVCWRDDGTVPTASEGLRIYHGQELDYVGDFANWTQIVGLGSPVLYISFYS